MRGCLLITAALTGLVVVAGSVALPAEVEDAAPQAGIFDTGRLNVHLVCHTHDDPGWLKTVDQYFYGANNTIAHAGVQYILDSVVDALERDPARRFVYAEQAFMWRWWRQQGPDKRERVRRLVSEGRLSFVNGGWVMHDEATAHYVGMVDQTHLGHAFLRREFGEEALPTVAWQIDPFGHSTTQASLLGAQAGFEALYFGRIDYQDREKRIAVSDMEMIWRSSRTLEENAQIFTGVFHSGNYGPPVGFCFDQACQDEPMMNDPLMADYNVERRASNFADACLELGQNTRGGDIMLQMGGDFGFEDANAWFKNLDILIDAVNKEGRVNVFYSTPERYTAAKHAAGLDWSVKKDDFFPYADCANCYWTGFYTSRPGLKRLERVTSGYLQAARQLLALAGDGSGSSREALAALERAQALAQHHDGVSGTSKQHVADDYAMRLDRAWAGVEGAVSAALAKLAFGGEKPGEELPRLRQCRFANVSICDATMEAQDSFVAVAYNPLARRRAGYIDVPVSWSEVCVTDAEGNAVEAQVFPHRQRKTLFGDDSPPGELQQQHPYTLVLPIDEAQPLGAAVFHVSRNRGSSSARAPEPHRLSSAEKRSLAAASGREPQSSMPFEDMQGVAEAQQQTLDSNPIESKPAGDEEGSAPSRGRAFNVAATTSAEADAAQQDFSISNELVTLTFNGSTGRLSRMEINDDDGPRISLEMDQGWFFYSSFSDGVTAGEGGEKKAGGSAAAAEASRLHQELPERLRASQAQCGGAYIFRPEDGQASAVRVGGDGDLTVKEWWLEEGPLVSEVHQVFSDWVTQTIRLRRGQSHAELAWSVGPIPVGSESAGKEVVSRFSAPSLETRGVFYTDANGREFQRRVRNQRPTWDLDVTQPVAGNYYPVTTAAFLRNDDGKQLSVLTDRPQGCSSLDDGSLELMAHRRLLTEDARGVAEALNETTGGMSHYPEWQRRGEGEVFAGTHYLMLSEAGEGLKDVRRLMDEVFSPFVAAFATEGDVQNRPLFRSDHMSGETGRPAHQGVSLPLRGGLITPLDERVGLMTLATEERRPEEGGAGKGSLTLLIRLAHRYAKGEHAELSLTVAVDLARLVRGYLLVSAEEVSLTGGVSLASRARRYEWNVDTPVASSTQDEAIHAGNFSSNGTNDAQERSSPSGTEPDTWRVELGPMEVKTFRLTLRPTTQ